MSVLVKTKLVLADKHQETRDTVSFIFRSDEIKSWKPGQHLHCTLDHPDPDARGAERRFTISSAPFEGHIQITTRLSDDGSSFKRALRGLVVGGTIEANDLDGDFTVDDPEKRLVFIAGGIGITPYRSILLALDHAGVPVNVDLLYANRDEDFPFKAELEILAQSHPGFRIHYFTGPRRLDERAVRAVAGDLKEPVFYASGPEPMVQGFEKLLRSLGVKESRIKADCFPGYSRS